MQYYIRRVGLESVARLGCLLGWLVALLPALLLAGVLVSILEGLYTALLQVKPVVISALGQELLRLDLLQMLQLTPVEQRLEPWTANLALTFIALALVLVFLGGLLWMITLLLAGLVYNFIASLGWGLALELKETKTRRS